MERFTPNKMLPREGENNDISSLAALYARVFATPPWNEYAKCNACNNNFGEETRVGDFCPKGDGGILIEYYPLPETRTYIKKELEKLNSVLYIEEDNGIAIAFGWGYLYGADDFLEEKYRTEQMKSSIGQVLSSNGIGAEFYYLSEVGVEKRYRGKGIGTKITSNVVDFARSLDIPLITRTNYASPLYGILERLGLRQILGPTPTGNIINAEDSENPQRVLFTG